VLGLVAMTAKVAGVVVVVALVLMERLDGTWAGVPNGGDVDSRSMAGLLLPVVVLSLETAAAAAAVVVVVVPLLEDDDDDIVVVVAAALDMDAKCAYRSTALVVFLVLSSSFDGVLRERLVIGTMLLVSFSSDGDDEEGETRRRGTRKACVGRLVVVVAVVVVVVVVVVAVVPHGVG
jgi:hypothetical protein